ncbi:MAG: hypothetical protein WDN50_24375 [Bradyrhizobium sp.]
MVWGSFEVFVADFVRAHLNAYPTIATRLLTDGSTKGAFEMKSIGIDELMANQFDVSNAMGNILVSKRRLDGIEVIRNVLKVMFPHHKPMLQQIGTQELYKLAQRRHLIVHRRGSVDVEYRDKTDDNYQVGETLKLTSEYIYQIIYLVRDVGISILEAAATSPEISGARQLNISAITHIISAATTLRAQVPTYLVFKFRDAVLESADDRFGLFEILWSRRLLLVNQRVP